MYHVLQLFILVDRFGNGAMGRFFCPLLVFSSLITHPVLSYGIVSLIFCRLLIIYVLHVYSCLI